MNNTFDLQTSGNNTMDQKPSLNMPSKEELQAQLAQLEETYNTTVKGKLDDIKAKLKRLRETEFDGVDDENSGESASTVKMTSQYEPLEVTINPNFLLQILREEQPDIEIEIAQLVSICMTLGESVKRAFSQARQKAHAGSEKIFNQFMEGMQPNSTDDKN